MDTEIVKRVRGRRRSGAGTVWCRQAAVLLLAGLMAGLAAGCGLHPDPPPQIPSSAYGGEGDRMAKCMEFASESYCEQQIWGGAP